MGASPPPKCTHRKNVFMYNLHLTYMRKRAKRASPSETFIFSDLKILVTSAYTYNQCSTILFFVMVWRYKRQCRPTHKTLTLRKAICMHMRVSGASELIFFWHFHNSETAISFNILLGLQILCWYK